MDAPLNPTRSRPASPRYYNQFDPGMTMLEFYAHGAMAMLGDPNVCMREDQRAAFATSCFDLAEAMCEEADRRRPVSAPLRSTDTQA